MPEGGGGNNSKAVLSALQSLQQKIRKLEGERSFFQTSYEQQKSAYTSLETENRRLMDEIDRLKAELAKMRHEMEMLRSQAADANARNNQAAASTVHDFSSERSELNGRIVALTEHKAMLERDNMLLKQKLEASEASNRSLIAKVGDLEATLAGKTWENNHMREQAEQITMSTTGRIEEHYSLRQRELEAKVIDTEKRLAEVTARLLAEQAHKNDVVSGKIRSDEALKNVLDINEKLTRQGQPKGVLKRAPSAFLPTGARTARGAPSMMSRPASTGVIAESTQRRSHGQYAGGATHRMAGAKATKPKNMQAKLTKVNSAKPVPFCVGRNAGRSHSVNANAQQALAKDSENMRTVAVTRKMPNPAVPRGRRGQEELHPADIGTLEVPFLTSGDRTVVETILVSLEEEFTQLTTQYQDLVKQAQDPVRSSADQLYLNTTLRRVIEMLERKGEQLNRLRNHVKGLQDKERDRQNIITSPTKSPAARKHYKSMKVLQDYRAINTEQPYE